ncbi:MAG TPA: hypothetical protein ENG40_02690 [Thermoprotei archaeon]|nr:hypothetical protein [Thermoprotei archaeon]
MSQYNVYAIKNIVERIIADARDTGILFTTIKIDRLEYEDKEIIVKGEYKSLIEKGCFEIVFNKNLDPMKINIVMKE